MNDIYTGLIPLKFKLIISIQPAMWQIFTFIFHKTHLFAIS
jgi:hypothetical protein